MIDLTLYKFRKRRNSTKIPSPSMATLPLQKVCYKDAVSIEEPVVILAADHGTAADHDLEVMKSNYAKMNNRYYWITSIVSIRLNHWEIHMEIDPLATRRAEILNTNVFAVYSANKGSAELVDSRLPRRTNGSGIKSNTPLPWEMGVNEGTWVLSVVNSKGVQNFLIRDSGTLQGVMSAFKTYVEQIRDSVSEVPLPTDPSFDRDNPFESIVKAIMCVAKDINETFKYMVKNLFNIGSQTISVSDASQNIKACIWFPFYLDTGGGSSEEIVIGSFKTGKSAQLLFASDKMEFKTTLAAPSPNFHETWLRRGGYAEWALHMPFAGTVPLPNDLMYPGRNIEISYTLTAMSGVCHMTADLVQQDGGGARRIFEGHAQLACNVMIGATNPNLFNIASNAMSVAQGVATTALGAMSIGAGNPYGANSVLGGASNTVQSSLNVVNEAINPAAYVVGGYNGCAFVPATSREIAIYCAWYAVSQDPPSGCAQTVGIPTFRQLKVSEVRGYLMCNGASVASEGTAREIDTINQYLNSGVFIE